MAESDVQLPALVPAGKPLSLIPVGLKEAALDSPTFRATTLHFGDQIDAVERWLDSYMRSASRMTQEAGTLENVVHTLLASSSPNAQFSEAVLDHDYTMLAMERFGDVARDFWTQVIGSMKKAQLSVVEPLRSFLTNDTKAFKDARRSLENTQKIYDGLLSRYFAQAKTKEPSALREDAFILHEAKRSYLKASMDFAVLAPQLVATLNSLLIKVYSEQWLDTKDLRETSNLPFTKHAGEINRIREWSKVMSQGERYSKYELLAARKEIEESAINAARPARDLDYYSASTVPYLGSQPPTIAAHSTAGALSSKQGWLFLRTLTGKPTRTIWIRRWFFVNHGIFGSLVQGARSGGVEESEKIGVLLCNVRPAFQEERRFCFEVKTKDATILLQAESQAELTQWIEVFEVAKQRAFEEPGVGDPLASGGNPTSDAAFAVSPAIAPELAARRADGQVAHIAEEVQGFSHISEPDGGAHVVHRHSIDVHASRKNSERADGESAREHAARLIHKLDLHRKSSAGSQFPAASVAPSPSSPGVASLISASHSALPVGPMRAETLPISEKKEGDTSTMQASSRLGPTSLANPPAPTNLSKTAVFVGAERGIDLGIVDNTGGVPSSIMANQWGTMNYGHLSRVERREVKATERSASASNTPHLRGVAGSPLPSDSLEPLCNVEPTSALPAPASPGRVRSSSAMIQPRKNISDPDTILPQRKLQGTNADFSKFYPQDMKAHDAQFRMLFPNVPQEDRVVLVFRASWNPEQHQDLPGRVFVTLNHMYFYSNHYGFVLVTGVALSSISSVSSLRSDGHDILYIRLEGRNGRDDSSLVMIKTFLEPAKLLEHRLNYLASNCSAEEPDNLDEVLDNLIKFEIDYENESYESADDEVFATCDNASVQLAETSLKVDRSLNYGGTHTAAVDFQDSIKFRLPTQPVVYTPKHMDDVVADSIFNISAKALFHVMFGDKSMLSHMLYRERRAEVVKQLPWMRDRDGCWTRNFEYEVNALNYFRRVQRISVIDWQTVNVANDHLCYVVTDAKTPWHLPYTKDFSMVTNFVITHVAKSKSNLRIFTKIQWKESPTLYKNLIRRHASNDLRVDGQDIMDLVKDQVQKLGPDCTTKKAITIFGQIGHQNEGAIVTSADPSVLGRPVHTMIQQRSLFSIIAENLSSFGASAASTVLMSIIGIIKAILGLFSSHALLSLLLLVSVSIQFFGSTQLVSSWWRDRSAASFMSRIGVAPNTALSKAIYLRDLDEIVSVQSGFLSESVGKCSNAFRTILSHSDIDSPVDMGMEMYTAPSTRSTAKQLRQTRQRMGSYRYNLMVAMRFVKSVEREIIQAEYENWLLAENTKCRQIGSLLASADASGMRPESARERNATRSKLTAKLGAENIQHVMRWYDEYCGSCYKEQEAVVMASLK